MGLRICNPDKERGFSYTSLIARQERMPRRHRFLKSNDSRGSAQRRRVGRVVRTLATRALPSRAAPRTTYLTRWGWPVRRLHVPSCAEATHTRGSLLPSPRTLRRSVAIHRCWRCQRPDGSGFCSFGHGRCRDTQTASRRRYIPASSPRRGAVAAKSPLTYVQTARRREAQRMERIRPLPAVIVQSSSR